MNSPAERLEFEDIILGFTNNGGVDVVINALSVQRIGYDGYSPVNEMPDGDGVDPGTDVFTADTVVPAGDTLEIATIGIASPASWRGWYGGGDVELEVWVTLTPDGGDQIVWQPEGGTIIHNIENPPCEPEDYGIAHGGFSWIAEELTDNGDGSATMVVAAIDCREEAITGLTSSDFEIYQMDGVVGPEAGIGTMTVVSEDSPGMYVLNWRYVAGHHDQLVLTIQEGEMQVDMQVTITVEKIKEEVDKIEGITSNVGDITNPSNTEKELTLTKTAVGSISFGPGLDLITNQEQLALLSESIKIEADPTTRTMRAVVDTTALTFLAGKSATIQFFDVAANLGLTGLTAESFRDLLDITVFDDGVAVGNLSDYFDWDAVVYDEENDVLTLPVHHFTEYVLGLASSTTAEADVEDDATAVGKLADTGQGLVFVVPLSVIAMTALVIASRKFVV